MKNQKPVRQRSVGVANLFFDNGFDVRFGISNRFYTPAREYCTAFRYFSGCKILGQIVNFVADILCDLPGLRVGEPCAREQDAKPGLATCFDNDLSLCLSKTLFATRACFDCFLKIVIRRIEVDHYEVRLLGMMSGGRPNVDIDAVKIATPFKRSYRTASQKKGE